MKSSCNFKRILSRWIDMLILQSVFRSTGNLAETWSGEDYLTHVNILKTAKPLSSVCSWFECSLQKRLANESSDLNENQITFGKCLGHGLRMTLFFQNITCTSPDTNMFGFFFFPPLSPGLMCHQKDLLLPWTTERKKFISKPTKFQGGPK